jgi:hypothetical protein
LQAAIPESSKIGVLSGLATIHPVRPELSNGGNRNLHSVDNLSITTWARWVDQRSGNGEIRVSREGITFAAPVLIVHYIEVHKYLPPQHFLKAIEESEISIGG